MLPVVLALHLAAVPAAPEPIALSMPDVGLTAGAPDLSLHAETAVEGAAGRGLDVPFAPAPGSGPLLVGREMLAASAGVLAADTLVLAAGYGVLQLFARGAIDPTAANFRAAFYGIAAAAVILPPLGSALFASWARTGPGIGGGWKAFLLSVAGNAVALAAGWALAPAFWAVVPVQLATMPLGASFGLHW
jgi:hypothetical protein